MQRNYRGLSLTAISIGLLSASIVGRATLPAASSVHPDRAKRCSVAIPCIAYTNAGGGDAVDGTSTTRSGNGISGVSTSFGSTGVIGHNSAGGWGIYGATSGPGGPGAGVEAFSSNTDPALRASVDTAATGATIMELYNSDGRILGFDDFGDLAISGFLFTDGPCGSGCSRSRRVKTYAPRDPVPTTEDVGEARLVDGRASVTLEHAFANVIDRAAGYVVLITPEGDNKGLYVAQRAATAFEVREAEGGHSTIAFAYRIVAHPYGMQASRLPFVDEPSAHQGVHR
jgi:hypothetical protein